MLKSEIEILTAVALNKCSLKQITSRSIATNSSYIIPTVNSLVHSGYIIKKEPKGYQLTEKGVQALLEFLPDDTVFASYKIARYRLMHKHLARTKEAIKTIEALGNEYADGVEVLRN